MLQDSVSEARLHCRSVSARIERALAILQEAEARLSTSGMTGVMWYNMGCYAARLGRFADAMRYLRSAANPGSVDARRYRSDPDLEPLRWRSDFTRLLHSLGVQSASTGHARRGAIMERQSTPEAVARP